MTDRHLVDPELIAGLDQLPSFTLNDETLIMINAMLGEKINAGHDSELIADIVEHRIITPQGHEIAVIVHTPRSAASGPRPIVLHMHGGGYVMGSAKTMVAGAQQMAVSADCVVASVDYRLAPATCHPGPIEDCYAALKWVHDNAAMLGADPARIAVAGESAGGGLAAALALLARDRCEVALIHQHLIYPMIDDRTCLADPHPFTGKLVWTPQSNHFGWAALLGQEPGSEGISPYAAAARAEDLSGQPNCYIHVGALDLFVEENIEYARRLIRAGVPTELHIYPGAYHGFDLSADADVVKRATKASMDALRRVMHP